MDELMDAARERALLRAFARSMGVETVVVPAVRTREVTDADRETIRARRRAVNDLAWEHYGRDALCVELGLTPRQVTGVLAAMRPKPGVARNRVAAIGITADPSTWPARPVEDGGSADAPPASRAAAAEPDDTDFQVVVAVWTACNAGTGDWNALRRQIARARRLWPHSIAGIVSRARQLGQLPSVAA